MNRDICIKISFLIVSIVVFSQITIANDINNKSLENVSNISDINNLKVAVITTEIPVTNGSPENVDKKPKSEIVFPTGYKINRTGIDSAVISSPGFQNMKFGIVQFYEPLGASTLVELKSHGINLYEAVDTGTLSYYSSFPANQTNYRAILLTLP